MGGVKHYLQVCGEATYVDDMKIHGMLHAALVVSSRPHAKILSVDATAAANVTLSLACLALPCVLWPQHCIALPLVSALQRQRLLVSSPLCCQAQGIHAALSSQGTLCKVAVDST